jgi:hypothetical protein
MLSDPGDPLLFLENPAGDVVAQNDDYEGRGFNSRIQHELESSGEYRIIATGVRQEKTFPYVLSLGGKAVTQDLRSISYGQTETGAIDEEDPRNDLGFHEPVTFEGSEGDVVSIRMSGAEDAYLRLVDPSGRTVTESVSEINRQRLGSSGEYTIVATSEQQDRTFIYDLELELAFNPDQLVTAVEDVLRTQNGETERYVTAMEAANDLVTAIGGGTIVSGVTTDPIRGDDPENDRIRGTVGHGYAVQVAEGDSEYTAAAVFASQRDVRTRDVRDWVDAHSTLGDAREFEEAEQGRVGLVTGTVPTRSL